jgi:peptidoglycan/LPS O-acetylase OafA/YrhL
VDISDFLAVATQVQNFSSQDLGIQSSLARPERIVELDALRGIAALGVMYFHYAHRYAAFYPHKDPLWWPISHHTFGIPMFFMLSGYLIYMILSRTERPLDFIVSRFSRLYPAYWFCLLVTFAAVGVCGLPGREASWTALAGNFLMFHELLGIEHVDGAYWTLTLELCFYTWMLALFVSGQLKRVDFLALAWVVLTIWYDFDSKMFFGHRINETTQALLLIKYAQYFAAGIVVYRLRFEGFTALRLAVIGLCLASPWITKGYPANAIAFFGMALFLAAVFKLLPVLRWRPLLWVGGISYPLYLLHQNIGFISIRTLSDLGLNSNLAIFATIALMMAPAWAVTRWIEMPAISAIRSRYKSWRAPAPAAPAAPEQAAAEPAAGNL